MKTPLIALLAGVFLTSTVACAGAPRSGSNPPSGSRSGNVIAFSGTELSRGTMLLESLAGRVRNMRVERRPGRCPDVTIRGQRTIMNPTYPLVYVDGTAFRETCILDQIRVSEIERVEIYPNGFTPRPGYRTSPYGLILVFLTAGTAEP
jgi:hypothetical protein